MFVYLKCLVTKENMIKYKFKTIDFYLAGKRLTENYPEFQVEWLLPFYEGTESDIFATMTRENWIEFYNLTSVHNP